MPDTEERRRLEELLPFYVNGTLDPEETRHLEAALAEDASLRAELAFVQALRGVVQEERPQGLGELGERRLLRSIRQEKRASRLRRAVVPIAIAASLLLVAQVVTIGVLSQDEVPGVVEPLGETAELQVVFTPDATEAEIRTLLFEAGATIVDGPSALGVYRLDAEDPAAALDALEARSDLVAHVAREGAG